jgi:hypothetical protein
LLFSIRAQSGARVIPRPIWHGKATPIEITAKKIQWRVTGRSLGLDFALTAIKLEYKPPTR